MSGRMNEVLRLLSELSLSDNPKKQLSDLKATLLALSMSRKDEFHRNLELTALFDSLNSSDREQVELAVDVLGQLLPHVSSQEVVERFSAELLRGLDHPHEKVRCLVLKQVSLCAETESGVTSIRSNRDLLLKVIKSLSDKSLGVVKLAIGALGRICSESSGLNAVFSNESATHMQHVMAVSDSSRFNVYEFLVKVCLMGETQLSVVSNSGLLERLISEVTTGDILTQLNALELLTPLALNPDGLTLLDRGGVIAKLQYLLSLAETDPMATMLMPGLIKFFGNLGAVRPWEMFEQYGSVVVLVLGVAAGTKQQGDPALQNVAIQTVAHIGSTYQGKMALAKCKTEMDGVMEMLGSSVKSAPSDLRLCCLEALTQLFTLQHEEVTEEMVGLLELWWSGLSGLKMEQIVGLARQPFSDLHCATLGLINALAALPWGQRLILNEPGLVEYILDRSTESDKVSKESKWTVVETLFKSLSTRDVFSGDQLAQIEKHYRQGPFYIEAQVEVALEGEG